MKPSIAEREPQARRPERPWRWTQPCNFCGQGVAPRDFESHRQYHLAERAGQLDLFRTGRGVTSP